MIHKALEGRHNLAQGVNPVYGGGHQHLLPSARRWRAEGRREKMGLNDRAHALSYVMSPCQGYPSGIRIRCSYDITIECSTALRILGSYALKIGYSYVIRTVCSYDITIGCSYETRIGCSSAHRIPGSSIPQSYEPLSAIMSHR